jgi:hypothetical protein
MRTSGGPGGCAANASATRRTRPGSASPIGHTDTLEVTAGPGGQHSNIITPEPSAEGTVPGTGARNGTPHHPILRCPRSIESRQAGDTPVGMRYGDWQRSSPGRLS